MQLPHLRYMRRCAGVSGAERDGVREFLVLGIDDCVSIPSGQTPIVKVLGDPLEFLHPNHPAVPGIDPWPCACAPGRLTLEPVGGRPMPKIVTICALVSLLTIFAAISAGTANAELRCRAVGKQHVKLSGSIPGDHPDNFRLELQTAGGKECFFRGGICCERGGFISPQGLYAGRYQGADDSDSNCSPFRAVSIARPSQNPQDPEEASWRITALLRAR